MAGKKKPGIPVKGINIKLRMINDLMDVTGSAKDSWNPAEISDDMKAIAYIHDLADTWNPAQLNEALKYLGFATIDSWNPAIIEETKNKLVKYFLPTDASGNPIELDLKGVLPYEVTALTIDLLPIQDLHGYDSPWADGAGKNKLPLSVSGIKALNTSGTWSGNAYTLYSTVFSILTDSDGNVTGVNVNGTPNGGNAVFTLYNYSFDGTSVILNGCPSGGSSSAYRLDAFGNFLAQDVGSGVTINNSGNANVRIVIFENTAISNKVFYPMIRLASVSDGTFAPYENICPISGRTEVNLTVADAETSPTQTETYTETLGQTVYGGKVDFVSGEGQNDYRNIDENSFSSVNTSTSSGGLHWTDVVIGYMPTNIISDRLTRKDGNSGWSSTTPCISYVESGGSKLLRIYCAESTISDFKTAYAGLQIVFSRETPSTFTFTPEEIELVNGENTLSTDGDNINITYKAILNS